MENLEDLPKTKTPRKGVFAGLNLMQVLWIITQVTALYIRVPIFVKGK